MEKILIADDHPLFRGALKQTLLHLYPGIEMLEAEDLNGVRETLSAQPDCELVLLDLHMPGSYGLAGLLSLRNQFPAVAVIMLTANENLEVIQQALDLGAQGYIPKRSSETEIATALQVIAEGGIWVPQRLQAALQKQQGSTDPIVAKLAKLTPQQHRVLELVAEGLLNKQIADRLNIQIRTIKAHVSAILEKLELNNRTQAGVTLRQLMVSDPDQQLNNKE